MTQEEIKKEATRLYEIIDISKKRLDELRGFCKHLSTHIGYYIESRGPFAAEICSDCGELIKAL